MKKTNNKGFSLVELIIVIAIMAILIGVLAPQYIKYVEKSRRSADVDLLDSVYKACSVAASDPEITDGPVGNGTSDQTITIAKTGTMAKYGEAVLSTLGVNAISDVEGKLKSKEGKGKSIVIKMDKNGNFTVEAGTLKVPTSSGS